MALKHIFREPTSQEIHEKQLEDARRQALEHRADAERSAALADMYEKRVGRLAGSAVVFGQGPKAVAKQATEIFSVSGKA